MERDAEGEWAVGMGELNDITSMHEFVLSVLREVIANLPPDTARIDEGHASNGDAVLSVIPARKDAAEIWVHVGSPALIDFGVEHETGWEMYVNQEGEWDEFGHNLKRFCNAVIEGKCEIRRGFISRNLTIIIEGRRVRSTGYFHFSLLPKIYRFMPYAP